MHTYSRLLYYNVYIVIQFALRVQFIEFASLSHICSLTYYVSAYAYTCMKVLCSLCTHECTHTRTHTHKTLDYPLLLPAVWYP